LPQIDTDYHGLNQKKSVCIREIGGGVVGLTVFCSRFGIAGFFFVTSPALHETQCGASVVLGSFPLITGIPKNKKNDDGGKPIAVNRQQKTAAGLRVALRSRQVTR
jgi:hypothetical protein